MTNIYTAIGEVIPAIVTALDGVISVEVFDGTPTQIPADTSYAIIGAGNNDPSESDDEVAAMEQEWYGLGLKARKEEMAIHCLAVGRASRIPAARALALAVVEEVGANLPEKPTAQSYHALITSVDRIETANAQSGATVHVLFTITVKARLVP